MKNHPWSQTDSSKIAISSRNQNLMRNYGKRMGQLSMKTDWRSRLVRPQTSFCDCNFERNKTIGKKKKGHPRSLHPLGQVLFPCVRYHNTFLCFNYYFLIACL